MLRHLGIQGLQEAFQPGHTFLDIDAELDIGGLYEEGEGGWEVWIESVWGLGEQQSGVEVEVETDERVVEPEHPQVADVPAEEDTPPGDGRSLLRTEQVFPHELFVLVLEGADHHVLSFQEETVHSLLHEGDLFRSGTVRFGGGLDDQVAQRGVDIGHVFLDALAGFDVRHAAGPLDADVPFPLSLRLPSRQDRTLRTLL